MYQTRLISKFLSLILLSAFICLSACSPNQSSKVNRISLDGSEYSDATTGLRFIRSNLQSTNGTVLLFANNTAEKTAQFLNKLQYDVALFEYPKTMDNQTQIPTLIDALKAYRLIQSKGESLELNANRLVLMGLGLGGTLAAKTIQQLSNEEQPDDVILISPLEMDETIPGTVYPAIMPPLEPKSRLWIAVSEQQNQSEPRCQEYMKTWIGYDGKASFQLLTNTINFELEGNLAMYLTSVLQAQVEIEKETINPAAVAVEGYNPDRHTEKIALVKKNKYDLIFIGNSITHNFDEPQYQAVWQQFFAPRKALNLGYSGYRTENLLWNIQNGELEGQLPKVIVLHIGTNNIDEKNYPTRHTASQLAGGIEAILHLLRKKCPDSKILLLRCFPGCYGGANPTSHRAILERASDLVSKLTDNKHIFYCDVNHIFLNMNGSINHDRMPDWLHPNPAGAKAWAQAMEPLLSQLMEDQSRDTNIPTNTAIVPVSKLEEDSYNWWNRHADVLRIKDSINPEIVLIGNSITHFWGGEPKLKYADGSPRVPYGPQAWDSIFHDYRVLNMGFGWDRTQNVLWRLDHGELDGLHPQKVIIHIGTNNTSQTENARINTATEIVEGIQSVCQRVRSKVPSAEIILMAVMPREQHSEHPRRLLIKQINEKLIVFAKENNIQLLNIGPKMLAPDGTLSKEIAGDFCHPSEKGYLIWANELRPIL